MDVLNNLLGVPLGAVMRFCYGLIANYGLAIILFTFITKIILFPLTIMVQKNSIKMIKLQPELNMISAQYADNPDKVSEEQLKLYKRENYKPLAGLIPMLIQIPLVLGVMQVIYNPLSHLLRLPETAIQALTMHTMEILGLSEAGSSIQVSAISLIQNPLYTESFSNLQVSGVDMPAVL